MTDCVRQRQVKPVVGEFIKLERASQLESESAAKQHERNVIQSMAAAFAELVRPHWRQRSVPQCHVAGHNR